MLQKTLKRNNNSFKQKKKELLQCAATPFFLQLYFLFKTFIVKTIQLYYNDDYEEYKNVKEENITDLVCI